MTGLSTRFPDYLVHAGGAFAKRFVSNRCATPTYSNITGNTGGNFYSGHYTPVDTEVSDLELVFTNILSVRPEGDGAGTIAIKAAIEYPVANDGTKPTGQTYPCFINGSRTLTLEPGGIGRFAPVGISIPANTYYRIHVQVVGAAWSEGLMPTQAALYEGLQRGTTTDRTTSSTGMTFTTGLLGLPPSVILGRQKTAKPTVGILGDSIAAGFVETAATYVGFLPRGLGNAFAWTNTAQPSLRAFDFGGLTSLGLSGTSRRRMDLLALGSTHVVDALGQNDVDYNSGGLTLAQIQAAKIFIWEQLQARGIKVIATTITPKVSSSDGFTTQAGLSPTVNQGPGGTRVGLNDWIRSGAPMVNGVAVAVGTPGALVAGDAGHPLVGYWEIADLVEVNSSGVLTRNTGIWKLSYLYTADALGVHPNDAGSIAMSAGCNLSLIQ